MKLGYLLTASAMIVAPSVASAQTASIFGNTSTAQLIGSIAAGQAYTVTGSGIIALCGSCNNSGPLNFNPTGTSTNGQGSYAAFNSAPQDHDPSASPSSPNYYGFYGPSVFLGALYGSFTATPTSAADLFLIGNGTTITAGAARTLYGVINDSAYADNPATAFTATLNRAGAGAVGGVPEPATWGMMLLGFGALGYAMRRRATVRTTVSFA